MMRCALQHHPCPLLQHEETRLRYDTDCFNLCFYSSSIPAQGVRSRLSIHHRIARLFTRYSSEVCLPLLCSVRMRVGACLGLRD